MGLAFFIKEKIVEAPKEVKEVEAPKEVIVDKKKGDK